MDPVIVTGAARSGTSMLMGCLHHCGLQTGSTCGPTPHNPRGQYENRAIVDNVQKPYLKAIGADPRGQYPLPDYGMLTPDENRRDVVLETVRQQGVTTGEPWGFKDAKALLDWPVWDTAFPDAIWVLTRRDVEANARSCMNTRFMRAHDSLSGWIDWAEFHAGRARDLALHAPGRVFVVDTEPLASGDTTSVRAIAEAVGLEWRPDAVHGFLDPSLWHYGGHDGARR